MNDWLPLVAGAIALTHSYLMTQAQILALTAPYFFIVMGCVCLVRFAVNLESIAVALLLFLPVYILIGIGIQSPEFNFLTLNELGINQIALNAALIAVIAIIGVLFATLKSKKHASPPWSRWHAFIAGAIVGEYFYAIAIRPAQTLPGAALALVIIVTCILFIRWRKISVAIIGGALIALDIGLRLASWESPARESLGINQEALSWLLATTILAFSLFTALFKRNKSSTGNALAEGAYISKARGQGYPLMASKPTSNASRSNKMKKPLLMNDWIPFMAGAIVLTNVFLLIHAQVLALTAFYFLIIVGFIFFVRFGKIAASFLVMAIICAAIGSIMRSFPYFLTPSELGINPTVFDATLIAVIAIVGVLCALIKGEQYERPPPSRWHAFIADAIVANYIRAPFAPTLPGAALALAIIVLCVLFVRLRKTAVVFSAGVLIALDVGLRVAPWEPPALQALGINQDAFFWPLHFGLYALCAFVALFRRKKA